MTLDDYFPFRGPCAFCGSPDARHRLFDSINGFHEAGNTVEEIAEEFEYPVEAILAALEVRD